MKNLLIFIISFLAIISVKGQTTILPEVVSSSGGDAVTTKAQLSWTVGEPVIATYLKLLKGSLTQGFHQGNIRIINSGTDNTPSIPLTDDNSGNEKQKPPSTYINVFPNPADNFITVALETDLAADFSFHIYDMSGKELIKHNMETSVEEADLSSLAKGSYIIWINEAGVPVKQFKIIIN